MAVSIITSHLQQCDSNGVPLNAGTVTVYASGTTTPLTLYSDDDLDPGDAVTNPITLDSSGRHAMVYIATALYKLVVKNSSGTTIYTHDEIDPGIAIGSGALPVANGGTGATTAASARTNLSAASSADMATAQSDISTLNTWTGNGLTTRTRVASGTTAQEPAAGTVGVRFNSTTGYLRLDTGAAWKNVPYAGQLLPADFATGQAVICLQRVRAVSTATTTINGVIPADTSIPQIGEGTQIFSEAFTPKSASSVIRLRSEVIFNGSGSIAVTIAFFQDSTANAIAAKGFSTGGLRDDIQIAHDVSLGSVTPVTFSVRIGVGSGSIDLNGGASFTFGGLQKSIFTIEEWLSP